jgi:hypothetical protein
MEDLGAGSTWALYHTESGSSLSGKDGVEMIRDTIRTIDEQLAGQRLSEQAHRRLLLDALDGALGQVEQLRLDDNRHVPRLLEDRIRTIVEAVDRRLGYDVDQFGSRTSKMHDIIFTAQSAVMGTRVVMGTRD